MRLKLPLEVVGTPKPAFEFVIVIAAKVVDDHMGVRVVVGSTSHGTVIFS